MAIRPEGSVLPMPHLPPIHCSLYLPALWEGLLGTGQYFRGCRGSRAIWKRLLTSEEAQRGTHGTSAQAVPAAGPSPASCKKRCEWYWLEIYQLCTNMLHANQVSWSPFTPSSSPHPLPQTCPDSLTDTHMQTLSGPVSSQRFTWCGQLASSQEGESE